MQVEYVGPGRYLASGWWGGVGRYVRTSQAYGAALAWDYAARGGGRFLPLRDRHAERMQRARELFQKMIDAEKTLAPCVHCGRIVLAGWCCEALRRAVLASDERPGGRPEEEE